MADYGHELDGDELNSLNEEELASYWDESDAARLLEVEDSEPEGITLAKVEGSCQACGNSKVRRRMIDLPILNNSVVLKDIYTIYCPACRVSFIDFEEYEDIKGRFEKIVGQVDTELLKESVIKGLKVYEKRWLNAENERKVVSIYFPSRTMGSKKAQVSLRASDPLYPQLRALSSEEVRKVLGIHCYEDLEKEAMALKRSISAYVKLSLAEFLDTAKEEDNIVRSKLENAIILRPGSGKLPDSRVTLPLAAETGIQDKAAQFASEDEGFVGELKYDYQTASLYLLIIETNIPAQNFDIVIKFDDGQEILKPESKVERNRLLLLEKMIDKSEHISQIILKKHGE